VKAAWPPTRVSGWREMSRSTRGEREADRVGPTPPWNALSIIIEGSAGLLVHAARRRSAGRVQEACCSPHLPPPLLCTLYFGCRRPLHLPVGPAVVAGVGGSGAGGS
jgi:hypothetical protein